MATSIIGHKVDTYEITAVLGKGGMGVVYKGRDTTLDRDVALKMMDARLAEDESFLKRFQSEARALAKLQNPNIVSIFALRETELGLCIVMEFVDGETLADRLRRLGPLPLSQMRHIFRQLLTAFNHAHNGGIIHRDIKPSNVMLTRDDIVKVTDFGLAKIQQPSPATMTVGTGGTLFYMSPEQIRGLSNVDNRGDLYSIGMTLYEALIGRVPFEDSEADFAIRQMIVDGKIPPPDKFNPDLPKDLVRVVQKSIAKDPDKRYQSASEMLEALEAADVPQLPVSVAGRVSQPPQIRSAARTWKWFAIAVGAGLLTMAVLWLAPRFRSPGIATLSVETIPAGASIEINGNRRGNAPLQIDEAKIGATQISALLEGYLPLDTTVTLMEGEAATVVMRMTKAPVNTFLSIRSDPPGASVFVEGVSVGETPLSRTVDPGTSRIRLVLDGYRSIDTTVRADEGKRLDVLLAMNRLAAATSSSAMLVLEIVPPGTVTVDGARQAASASQPARVEVKPGAHTITFEHPRYGSKNQSVSLKAGDSQRITCYFEGYVNIGVRGESAWGTIIVDGENTETFAPQARLPLGVGKHRIWVSRAGYKTVEEEKVIDISPSFMEMKYEFVFTLMKE